jgi:hypothetical protein
MDGFQQEQASDDHRLCLTLEMDAGTRAKVVDLHHMQLAYRHL